MTDAIAQVEEHIKALKKRDGIDTLAIEQYDDDGWMGASCTVKLWSGKQHGAATAKNFNLAYTMALKRLRGKNDTDGKS